MTTGISPGESGQPQWQPQEPADSGDPGVRDIVRMVGFLVAGIVVVLVVVAFVWGNGSAGMQRRARAESLIRAELRALPVYSGSVLVLTPSVTNRWDKPVSVTGTYSMMPGGCRSANTYYAEHAPSLGWRVTQPLTAGSDQDTTLSTFFDKMADGYTLEMWVECRDSDSYYEVTIDTL